MKEPAARSPGAPAEIAQSLAFAASADLPPSARRIAECISADGLARLVARYGGTALGIPRRWAPGWPPAEELGATLAKRLIEGFPGERLTVPMLSTGGRQQRNLAILDARRTGEPVGIIAKRFGLHTRTVYRILSSKREA